MSALLALRLVTYLLVATGVAALYEPDAPGAGRPAAAPPADDPSSLGPRRLREIRVPLA